MVSYAIYIGIPFDLGQLINNNIIKIINKRNAGVTHTYVITKLCRRARVNLEAFHIDL